MANESVHARNAAARLTALSLAHGTALSRLLRAHGHGAHADNVDAALAEATRLLAAEIGAEALAEAMRWVTSEAGGPVPGGASGMTH